MSFNGRQAAESNIALIRVRPSKRDAESRSYQFICNHCSEEGPVVQFLMGWIAVAVCCRVGAIERSRKSRPCKT
jgi:hypothetical protein